MTKIYGWPRPIRRPGLDPPNASATIAQDLNIYWKFQIGRFGRSILVDPRGDTMIVFIVGIAEIAVGQNCARLQRKMCTAKRVSARNRQYMTENVNFRRSGQALSIPLSNCGWRPDAGSRYAVCWTHRWSG